MTTTLRHADRIATSRGARRIRNVVASVLIGLGTLVVLVPLFLIFWYLLSRGLGAIDLDFFTRSPAPPGEAGGGLLNAIVGTFMLLIIASLIGVTIGIGGGIFLAEFPRHRLVPLVRLVSDVLSGIPAIVLGLVAYGLIVVTTRQFSAWAGGVALGLLMIPIVVRTTEEVLKLVPTSVREAGLSLGLPQWRVTLSIVLPAATSGIVTGVMLAVARVAGEAAPLLFTALGNNLLNLDPSKPVSALPLSIYVFATSAYPEQQRLAIAGALVLILIIFVASLVARVATRRR
ncbi:phosphate ABC transporter permease PstA [Deinococcus pimensis]|uniref:phosphate ABC transporter permease PstA n=1 Tax=Deinococcus pimensis TaxID=309888 RepID=UPI0004BA9D9C|nr:phosphate ABC transporter permease PstA [Deinococcus pimensis]